MITHVIVELKYPVENEYFHIDTVFPNQYYGYGTPLIRCKDCKWYSANTGYHWGRCENYRPFPFDETDYCSLAERKEE